MKGSIMPLHHLSAGDGPPILLSHGAAEDAGMLTPQAQAGDRLVDRW